LNGLRLVQKSKTANNIKMVNKSDILSSNATIRYNPKIKSRANNMSRQMTKCEQILWFNILSKKQLGGFKFIKQKQVFSYIVDFYCSELLLVVEVDGSSHNSRLEYDKQRDNFLRSCGLEIVRIINNDVEKNIEGVYLFLLQVVKDRKITNRQN
jgi:very-short-patch-repair endonuclease